MNNRVLLLIIIYLAFISLGIPDNILGVAWPEMRLSFDKPIEAAGILLTLTTVCSVVSSFSNGFFIRKLGTGLLLLISVSLTAMAMLGYSLSPVWLVMLLFTVPLGLGQGAVDSSLNSYVAQHYSSRHMNWLHCCWGIGGTGGPMLIAWVLLSGLSWRTGYLLVAIIQLVLTMVFAASLKLWQKGDSPQSEPLQAKQSVTNTWGLSELSGCLFYFFYTGVEASIGLWCASFLMEAKGLAIGVAGLWTSLYWASLTLGRIISGLISNSLGNVRMIRLGLAGAFTAGVMLTVLQAPYLILGALLLMGFSLAPLYPSMMHDTPRRRGAQRAASLIGFQVGSAFIGVAAIPVLFGWLAARASFEILGPVALFLIIGLIAAHEISLKNIVKS